MEIKLKKNRNNLPSKVKLIFLMGPTASGKTELAIKIRKNLPVELVNADSALIYREMDIGTSKPTKSELYESPHRLLNIVDPSQIYSVANFHNDALSEIINITTTSEKIPLFVGGTMLYFKLLLTGISHLPSANYEIRREIKRQAIEQGIKNIYQLLSKIDPIAAEKIHPNDFHRISRALEVFLISGKTITEMRKKSKNIMPYQVYQFAIATENRKALYQKIEERFHKMLISGFEQEVQSLFSRGDLHAEMPSIRCIGYRQMWSYLEGKISYGEMIHQSIYAARNLAKRQITWLKNWKWKIHWLRSEENWQKNLQKISKIVNNFVS